MASVINHDNSDNHTVDKYSFKVLSHEEEHFSESDLVATTTIEAESSKDNHPGRRESDIDASAMSSSSKDSLIESLMKKTDDMSSNFIKLQMKLETMSEEHKDELLKTQEASYAEGLEAGVKKAIEDANANMAQGLEQFSVSVKTLEESAHQYSVALESIKEQLVSAAVDIAREVVGVELSSNSDEIARVLSLELIKELQSASKITLKVNPKNHGLLSEQVGSMEHVEIVSDSAVNEGGVVAISDAGNIDSEILKRFERVKKAALSE